jgi:hypothetical protein
MLHLLDARPGQALSYLLSLVVVGVTFGGLLCESTAGDSTAMECCQDDGSRCNMPEKTEDCCSPNRNQENPTALTTSSSSNSVKQRAGLDLSALEYTAPPVPTVAQTTPAPRARGFPDRLTNRPLIIPLLI